ncbi:MAG TPA: hypothetical protein VFS23_07340 [Vicinamibacterales bacterium]|nr:hypothetical protein [Vicinamibacterales bacterium]
MRTSYARIVAAGLLTAVIACSSSAAQEQRPSPPPSDPEPQSLPGSDPASRTRQPGSGNVAAAAAASASTATIRGSVFYNDRRTDGLFGKRNDKNDNQGQRCTAEGKRDGTNGAPCSLNWLAGKYMVVDVIERDRYIPPRDAPGGCKTEEVVASATVAYDGSFTATFGANDACEGDTLPNLAIELRVRLRFCNASSFCFSINRSAGNPYTISHPSASAANPLTLRPGNDITVAAMNFSTAADASKPNNDSIAANYYASIVDTVLALHKDSTIPFYYDEFGELEYIFPSAPGETKSATAKSASRVVISNYQSQPDGSTFAWVDGKTPAHEYGHVLMLRTWNGAYGFDGIGITAESDVIAPSQQIAFKEGWAEFIPRVVFPETRGCARSSYDDNGALDCSEITQAIAALEKRRKEQVALIEKLPGSKTALAEEQLERIDADLAEQRARLADCQKSKTSTNLPGQLGEGAMWRDNITKALCDWYDGRVDNDTRLAGEGDRFTDPNIYSMWYNLRRMHLDALRYGGKIVLPGLWFCDYVSYYLNVRKSASEVGASSHAEYDLKIRDLIYNNNIGCSLPAPPGF